MRSYTTRANGIIVLLYIDKHGIFGVVLSSNSLISCSFTLAKRSTILFFSLLIGYEVIGNFIYGVEFKILVSNIFRNALWV